MKLEVIQRDWFVNPASESRLDKKAAAEVERQFTTFKFDLLTRGMLGAVLKGFAVAEVIWANVDGVWTATAVKVRKQRRFRFTVDGELRLLTRSNTMDGEAVPERKFIVHRHSIDDDDDDPYGVGIGSVLFWPAWFKRQVLAHWLRGTEKAATPTTVGTYSGGFDKTREDQLLAAMRRMANDTGIAVPETVELQLLEAKNGGGGDFYEKLARYLDELMSEAVLGETLTTNSGERGARSLGEIHNEIRIAIAKAASDLISDTLKGTLIRWIVELNYPGAGLPDVYRDFSEAEDLDKKVDRDKKLVDMGYRPSSIDYINETYGGDWIEKPAAAPAEIIDPKAAAGAKLADRLAFAERQVSPGEQVVNDLTDQLEQASAPILDTMIERIRTEFQEARDYDDLVERLARLSSETGVDDLASLLEQGMTLARLEGHDSVSGNG